MIKVSECLYTFLTTKWKVHVLTSLRFKATTRFPVQESSGEWSGVAEDKLKRQHG